jgi:hypothetical protein
MERKSINPWSWSIKLGFDQAQIIEGNRRQLVCCGQDAVDADGKPHMTLANIVRLNVYATDVDELFKHWARLADRFVNSGGRFVTSVLGVTRLAAPQLPRLAGGNRCRLTHKHHFTRGAKGP